MKKIFAIIVIAVLALPALSFAHGGGLDGYGCHHNRKQGGYHCHRGPLAGEVFASQGEMLKALEAQQKAAKKQEKKEGVEK